MSPGKLRSSVPLQIERKIFASDCCLNRGKDYMLRNTRSHVFAVFFVIIFGLTLPASGQNTTSQGRVPPRITAPVDNEVRTAIPASTHPLAQAKLDRGPVDPALPMERMILILGASDEQEQQLRTFLDSQQTKGSPDYHQWLTPEAFGQRFGPSPQDVQQVTNWLQQGGFRVGAVAKSGRWIEFSGTAEQVQNAFRTEMRTYQAADRMHIANASDISIPAALAGVVRGVSLHDFFKKPLHRMNGKVHGVSDGTNPNATLVDQNNNVVHALAPGDFAAIYDINRLYNATPTPLTGSNETIGIVARSDIDLGDTTDFESVFGLPGNNPPNVILNGPDPGDVPGDDVEATLDAEWSHAVAPDAGIDLVISASTATTDGVDLSSAYIVEHNLDQVMSLSFGLCEVGLGAQENQFINALWQQAAAQGISVFVSAGDDGAAACDDPNNTVAQGPVSVSGLASTPYNTAVGGTEFQETQGGQTDATYWNTTNSSTLVSVKGYIPEMVWNESCSIGTCGINNANLFAGSGGVSSIYTPPSYQASTGIPGLNFPNRALPDVSIAAAGGHDGFLLCFQRVCQAGPNQAFFIIGGTSASSPAMAGIMAIIDQKISPGGRQGLANYVLYSLAKAETFSNCNSNSRTNPATPDPAGCVFNDVTTGNNTVPGETGFTAGAGFDLASGLGSVDATNLANAFAAQAGGFQGTSTTLAANPAQNPITITHGSAITFDVGVTRTGATGTPSGTISLKASGGLLPLPVGVDATTLSGSGATANGTFNISNLPGGSGYNLVAHYPGDGVFAASDSSPLTVTVNPENSTTTLTSIVGFNNTTGAPIVGTTINYGGFLDLRTVITSATNTSPPDGFPSGTITVNDNSVAVGTLTVPRGTPPNAPGSQAELINCVTPALNSPICLTVGPHPISISYNGDAGFNPSATAGATTITVNKGTPTGTVSAPATATFGTPITVSAQVNALGPVFPTGTVQFLQGTTPVGSPATLTPGNPSTASAQITLSGTGNQVVNAQYLGDSTYNTAMFGPSTVTVSAPFNFTATSTSQTIPAGGTATYNVTLSSVGGFTGAVNFNCTGAPGGSNCAVSPNPANLTGSTTTVPLTVTVSNTANARLGPSPFRTWPVVFAAIFAGLLWGSRKKPRKAVLMLLALGLMIGVVSCGGGGSGPPIIKNPTLATLTVTGTSGSATNTINLTLTITH
jgi:pro-kumamolisin-like protein/Big-like domain-containing protein